MIKGNQKEIQFTESSQKDESHTGLLSNSKSWGISDSSKFYSPREKSPYREYLPVSKQVNLIVPSKLKSSTLQQVKNH